MVYEEFRHHIRIKILKQNAVDRANVKEKYKSYGNDQSIVDVNANTFNLDATGNIVATKLEKNLVYDKKITSRLSEISFTLPNVKPGSVIEYRYTIRGGGPRYWNLQSDIPVLYSKFVVDFPSLCEIYIRPLCTLPFKNNDESNGMRTIKKFSMENIPALRDEKYLSCENDYLQRIESYITAFTIDGRKYSTLRTWTKVAEELLDDEDFGRQLTREIPRTADLDAELKTTSSEFNKMVVVHNYVRKNMKWDGVDNLWALNGVKSAWKNKHGTSGEINLILVNLLKDAGLKAFPIMLSTHDHGVVSIAFPQYSYFNKVMALVEIDGKSYVLDGTDKYTPASLIPFNVMCGEGLVIDSKNENKYRWHQLWDDKQIFKNTVVMQARIGTDGLMKGFVNISSAAYARVKRAPYLEKTPKEYLSAFYLSEVPGLVADSLTFDNRDVDSLPLLEKFVFSVPMTQSGEYAHFSPNIFSGLKKNPFIADRRYSDVFFGANQQQTIIANFIIPDGYEAEELPKNIRLVTEDKSLSVSRLVSSSGHTISTRITLDYKRPFYTVEEYADLKEFYKQLYALLDEQFVIKKTTATAGN